MYTMLFLNLIFPLVFILVAVILKKYPVSDMRKQSGYNTPTSRKSQAHWDYAQKIAPDIYLALGKQLFMVELLASLLLFFLQISVDYSLWIGEGIGFLYLFYSFYYIDRKINEKIKENQP